MTTGMSGIYRWTAVDIAVPAAYVRVVLCRLVSENEVRVEEGECDENVAWWSVHEGRVDDVTHWAALPDPPSMGQIQAVHTALHPPEQTDRPPPAAPESA